MLAYKSELSSSGEATAVCSEVGETLPITDTELKLMAAAAMIGFSSRPKDGKSTPAPNGPPERILDECKEQVLPYVHRCLAQVMRAHDADLRERIGDLSLIEDGL